MEKSGYRHIENALLTDRNTLRVATRAQHLIEIHEATQLPRLLSNSEICAGKILILGAGSNVLFANDYVGTIIVIATRGIHLEFSATHTYLTVAAGERWHDLVRWSLKQGLAGLENLVLIPGTVGAAPIQNIGAYGVEVAEFIDHVEVWDNHKKQLVKLGNTACRFSYRDSIFKREPERYVVLNVCFLLPHKHRLQLSYMGIQEELAQLGIDHPRPFDVAQAVTRLRTRKLPDPKRIGNVGSFFKNPMISAQTAHALKQAYPNMPMWPQTDGHQKLSAAWLIEAAGFKGYREGDAGISEHHALVLVNHGDASGQALWSLAKKVARSVESRFGVRLIPEPRVVEG